MSESRRNVITTIKVGLLLVSYSTLMAQLSDFDFNYFIHDFSFTMTTFPIHEQDFSIKTGFISTRDAITSQTKPHPLKQFLQLATALACLLLSQKASPKHSRAPKCPHPPTPQLCHRCGEQNTEGPVGPG